MFRHARLLSLAVAVTALACGSDKSVAPPVVATVVVTPGTDTLLALGRTRQFTAVAQDANGAPVTGVTLVWRSSMRVSGSRTAAAGLDRDSAGDGGSRALS